MRRALGAVADGECVTVLFDDRHNLANRVDGAECVGDMTECNDACAIRHHRSKTIQIDSAFWCELADAELRATLDGELLPGNEVGVMLECGDDDRVVAPVI